MEINKNPDTTLAVLRENPDFELVELPGAGHFANWRCLMISMEFWAGFLPDD